MASVSAIYRTAVVLLFGLFLQACASTEGVEAQGEEQVIVAPDGTEIQPTVVSFEDYNDPLIGLNRAIFSFNDVLYRYALIPVTRGYTAVLPQPVRNSITNAFHNIKSPIYFVNNLLQGKPRDSMVNLARFGINSTVGVLGLFDNADAWFGIEPAHTELEDTLASWGSGYGVYLVLPVFGPADVRDGIGRIGDYFLNPIVYLTDNPERLWIQGLDGVRTFTPQAETYLELRNQAEDPYIFIRNTYLQGVQRNASQQ